MIVEVSVKGLDKAVASISLLANPDRSQLMRMLGLKLQQQTVRHFQIGAGPYGAWAPTQRGGQILVDTGRLMGSIQNVVHSDSVSVGTNVHYGRYHQEGTRRMPARAFLGLSQSDMDEVKQVIVEYLDRLVAA